MDLDIQLLYRVITPLNIINRTPEGRLVQCSRATLPVNQLYQAPIKDGHSDSNVRRCITPYKNYYV